MQAPTRRRVTPVAEEEGRLTDKPVESVEQVGLLPFVCDVFLSFVFWSMLAEAVPALWYIPMNLMRISGTEPLLFIYMLAGILTVRRLREFIWNHPLVNLIAVPSLLTLHSPTVMWYGATAMVCSGLHLTVVLGQLMHPSAPTRDRRVTSLGLGLLTLVVVRFGLSSVSPLYLYENANIFAIVLSIVASLLLHKFRSAPVRSKPASKAIAGLPGDLMIGTGLGCFLFLNIVFLSEHGVLARWDNAHPFPIGLGVMACMVVGLLISRQSFVRYANSHSPFITLHF